MGTITMSSKEISRLEAMQKLEEKRLCLDRFGKSHLHDYLSNVRYLTRCGVKFYNLPVFPGNPAHWRPARAG